MYEIDNVIRTLKSIGFRKVKFGDHISLLGETPDGIKVPLTMPNQKIIQPCTVSAIIRLSGVLRNKCIV
jgi:hypothetical protein